LLKSYKIETIFPIYHPAEIKSNIFAARNKPYICKNSAQKPLLIRFQPFQTSSTSCLTEEKELEFIATWTAMPVSVAIGLAAACRQI
jgi:hypothetical protein